AVDTSDEHNAQAGSILREAPSLVTSEHVLLETWNLIRSRGGHKAADRFWERMRGGLATVEPVGLPDWESAWQIGLASADQRFSLVDRTSFGVMVWLGIEPGASFVHHFVIFHCGPNRRRALTVVS